jgi:hypothetical protein
VSNREQNRAKTAIPTAAIVRGSSGSIHNLSGFSLGSKAEPGGCSPLPVSSLGVEALTLQHRSSKRNRDKP